MDNKQRKSLEELQKRVKLDETNDIFLDYLNKKMRNINKKLEQITELEQRAESELKQEQKDKISAKQQLKSEYQQFFDMKVNYYISHDKATSLALSEIMKQSEQSVLNKVACNTRNELVTELFQLLLAGKLIQYRQCKVFENLTQEDEEQIYRTHEKLILLQNLDENEEELTISEFSQKKIEAINQYLQNFKQDSAKKIIDSFLNNKKIQDTKFKYLQEEQYQNEEIKQDVGVEVIQEKSEKSDNENNEQSDNKTEKIIDSGDKEKQTSGLSQNYQSHYEGDSENSQLQSGGEKKYRRNQFNQNSYSEIGQQNQHDVYYRKKGNYNTNNTYQNGNNSKKFYYKKREFDDSYEGGDNIKKNQNYHKSRNPMRSNNYHKDYDTDKELNQYSKNKYYKY